MNQLKTEKRAEIARCLVEGNSIRATCRITGAAKDTVTKLLRDLGHACHTYQDRALRGLTCKRVQVDEVWSFVHGKDKNLTPEQKAEGLGSVWTWTAIDADTKLVPSWLVGGRDAGCAHQFVTDLASRLANRIQLTSDGHSVYLDAVDTAFEGQVDYSMLVKLYGVDPRTGEARYSPAICTGCKKMRIRGRPDPDHVSTSFVERQNLTMRMSMRRFTRLTNGFSKKVENLHHAVSLHFMYYNFARRHQTLRVAPAMAAGVSDHLWSIEEIVALLTPKQEQ